MLPLALTAIAAGASAVALLVVRYRRVRRSPALGGRATPLPVGAGLKHLATTMTDLSDVGFHLHGQRALHGKLRLGELLHR